MIPTVYGPAVLTQAERLGDALGVYARPVQVFAREVALDPLLGPDVLEDVVAAVERAA